MEAAQCAHHYYNTFVEAMHWRLFLLTYESNWNWERSNFQGIQINFAPPRPAGFANFRGAGRGGARLAFLRGGAERGSPFFAGRGGAPIPDIKLPLLCQGRFTFTTELPFFTREVHFSGIECKKFDSTEQHSISQGLPPKWCSPAFSLLSKPQFFVRTPFSLL